MATEEKSLILPPKVRATAAKWAARKEVVKHTSRHIKESQLTVWRSPNQVMDTGLGDLSYRRWCQAEQHRLADADIQTDVVNNTSGHMALFGSPG